MITKIPRISAHHPSKAIAEIDRVSSRDHFVQFYKDDSTLIACVARFFAVGFAQGNVAVMIATLDHRQAIEERLREMGVNLESLRASGDYTAFDAREMLSNFMINGRPDLLRFRAFVGTWMDVAVRAGRGVRAFGEMVALLNAQGNATAALEVERLWNDLSETHEFSLYCAYPSSQFAEGAKCESLSNFCAAHSRVITGS